ncbi:trimeric intracellular cation channel family protein [Streptomyces sp. ODS28]|uniref:trimeric intracellular cation channel family protein n=1 Tax=Streptomyces sp. ODS28 TaxID=3136688 RepID=UPI0031EFEFEC
MLHVLYLIGIAAFAASGVLAAHEARMDPFGGLVLGFAAAISGGTLRDVLLDRRPLYWTHDWVLLAVIAGVAVLTGLYLAHRRSFPHRTLLLVDALGLSVVTVIGARAALEAGVTPPAVVILAVLTGVTGEIVRDLLCGESPPLLLREDFYATAAAVGALCFLCMNLLGVPDTPTTIASAGVVFLLRLCAIRYGLRLPTLSPAWRSAGA